MNKTLLVRDEPPPRIDHERTVSRAAARAAREDLVQRQRRLFRLIRSLHAGVEESLPAAALAALFETIEQATDEYFAAEERLLAAGPQHEFEQHCADHQRILQNLARQRTALRATPKSSARQAVHALDALLVHHAIQHGF